MVDINKDNYFNWDFDIDEVFSLFKENNLYLYKDIYSLLLLISYDTFIARSFNQEDVGPLINAYQRGRCSTGYKGIKKLIIELYEILCFVVLYVRTFGKRKSGILMSNTFICSERYDSVKRKLSDVGFTGIITLGDINIKGSIYNIRNIIETLRGNDANDACLFCRPVFLCWNSIAGTRLKKLAERWVRIVMRMYNKQYVNPEKIETILNALEKEYNNRKRKIKKLLCKKKIYKYMTVNQYNIGDLLIIDACNELGIETVQIEHHTSQFGTMKLSGKNDGINQYMFVKKKYVWNWQEKIFHQKVYKNIYTFQDESVGIDVIGNLEFCYEDILKALKKYPAGRRITLISPFAYAGFIEDSKEFLFYENFRLKILVALKKLSEEKNIIIRVRYHPSSAENKFKVKEIPLLKMWGFEISKSTPDSLIEDLCSSVAVVGVESSVLSTARTFGRRVYRVDNSKYIWLPIDPEVINIKVDDIPKINIGNGTECLKRIKREDFFDVDVFAKK